MTEEKNNDVRKKNNARRNDTRKKKIINISGRVTLVEQSPSLHRVTLLFSSGNVTGGTRKERET